MKKTHFLITAIVWVMILCGIQAQQLNSDYRDISKPRPCLSDDLMRAYKRPCLTDSKKTTKINKDKLLTGVRPDEYVIPVVFHIFGTNFYGKQVNDEIVIDALQKTNQDFQGLTSNWGDPDPTFDALKKEFKITFKLAQKDPVGNATTGIVYHASDSGFGNPDDTKAALYAWDNYSYMNVYITLDLFADGVTNNSGASWGPIKDMSDKNLARIVYNPLYLGKNTQENFRRLLTHEFGHFLNLEHTFNYDRSKFADGCSDASDGTPNPGDHVDDTPPANMMFMGANDLNCHGQKTNWTNFMNYSERYSMFTAGQVERMKDALDHEARVTLWQKENLDKVFFSTATPRISLSNNTITESTENNGSFNESYNFVVKDVAADISKTFVYGADYTIDNLPAGLTPKLIAKTDSTLTLSFIGKAPSNMVVNNINNLLITLNNSILVSGTLYRNQFNAKMAFRDPYQITYIDSDDIEIGATYPCVYFKLDKNFEDSKVGVWFEKDHLRIETYTQKIVCEENTANITFIKYGEAIDNYSNWSKNVSYPNQQDLYTHDYTTWKGKTGFVGFQFGNQNNTDKLYGWIKLSVADDGESMTLKDYAYNRAPNTVIIAGQKEAKLKDADLVFSSNSPKENAFLNDGSVEKSINILIMGDNSFTKTGLLTYGTDYSFNKLPKGLTPQITVIDPLNAVISFTGKAKKHELTDSISTKLTFEKTIFKKKEINDAVQKVKFYFLNKYNIITQSVNYLADASHDWFYFKMPQISADFGTWRFDDSHLKLQTYGKPAICYEGTQNYIPLGANVEIGPNSTWTTPINFVEGTFNLRTNDFTEWQGKTAYVGLSIPYGKYTLYGWMKISVSQDGSSFNVLDWAYNENPGKSILTGQIALDNTEISIPNENVDIFPNPVSDKLTIKAPDRAQILIYNIKGDLILSQHMNGEEMNINVRSFNKGFYLVRITKDKMTTVRKIFVE